METYYEISGRVIYRTDGVPFDFNKAAPHYSLHGMETVEIKSERTRYARNQALSFKARAKSEQKAEDFARTLRRMGATFADVEVEVTPVEVF